MTHVPVLPEHPSRLWGNPTPRSSYDVVIVGGGGHGLATAYYLASTYGVSNIAVTVSADPKKAASLSSDPAHIKDALELFKKQMERAKQNVPKGS